MRINERMGLVYTALFLTVSVAVITQNSDSLMASFRGEANVKAVDDIFTVSAGRNQRLFVLRNDVTDSSVTAGSIKLISLPGCGKIVQSGGSFQYSNTTSCTGNQTFSYCLSTGRICEPASVTLRMIEARDPIDSILDGPVTDLSGFETQVGINSMDLEITNVRLGKVAAAETTSQPVAGMKLAKVAAEVPSSIRRPAPFVGLGNVSGTFEMDAPADFGRVETQVREVAEVSATDTTMTDAIDPASVILPQDPQITGLTARLPELALHQYGTIDLGFKAPKTMSDLDRSPFGTSCKSGLTAKPVSGAMVELTVNAPCLPNTRVEIRHGRMVVTQKTSHTGDLVVIIPALETKARFAVDFGSNRVLRTTVTVSGLDKIERTAIQWRGDIEVDLHALEFGADIGSTGHVWEGQARAIDQATRFGGGYTTQLGDASVDNPIRAEIYSIPLSRKTKTGVIELVIAATGTPESCAKGQILQSYRSKGGRLVAASGLQFKLPDCGSETQSIVLKNAVRDMIIAGR